MRRPTFRSLIQRRTLFRSGPLTRPGQPQQVQPGPDAALVPGAGRPQA
jgi:hypothetical protein